jgi:hypothetical protein
MRRALVALALLACAAAFAQPADDTAERRIVSLFALGDTGQEPGEMAFKNGQLAVAAALAAEDRRAPINALVLLGDNFYPDGLEEDEVEERVRENLVGPYCRFVELRGSLSGEVDEACSLAREERRPVPIFAVLGNHDYERRESPRLQRQAVPRYVSNWRMPQKDAELVELEGGVSLVLFDSTQLYDGRGADDLARALRRAQGPWLVLAAHHPPIEVERERYERGYIRRVAEILDDADRTAHVFLAGHEHNLQLVKLKKPLPRLLAIAGGGSEARGLRRSEPKPLFAVEREGFARVDLIQGEGRERLRVTLFGAPGLPILVGSPEALASAEVELDGSVRFSGVDAD